MGLFSGFRGADAMKYGILPKTRRLMKTSSKSQIERAQRAVKMETSSGSRIYSGSAKSEMFHMRLAQIKRFDRRKK